MHTVYHIVCFAHHILHSMQSFECIKEKLNENNVKQLSVRKFDTKYFKRKFMERKTPTIYSTNTVILYMYTHRGQSYI